MELHINANRVVGARDMMIYGHFLEHFHRQIYGGVFAPDSPLADTQGFRTDVINALKQIKPPVVRWPGGCFVSAYHWKDAVGKTRRPYFDKAWRVEEPCTFGTDEFLAFCERIGAEPYLCSNAGTGTEEELADWVEYCNLEREGPYAKMRIANGHKDPFAVKYWSIGNENWGAHEIGAKKTGQWGQYVAETAKMAKRVDPSIQLFAASIVNLDWNIDLLRQAGAYLDWISVHNYWDGLWQVNDVAPYEKAMLYSLEVEAPIRKTRHILGALDYLGKIRIAFDEWNLKGWHHPNIHQGSALEKRDYLAPRDKNDINSDYTMADAVFTACFLNACLRNCDCVGMANYSPTVNTRGMIYTHAEGIVLRPTYHVYDLYVNLMQEVVLDSFLTGGDGTFEVEAGGKPKTIPALDAVATRSADGKNMSVALINRHPDKAVDLSGACPTECTGISATCLAGSHKDDYNDIGRESSVKPEPHAVALKEGRYALRLPAHSVTILSFI